MTREQCNQLRVLHSEIEGHIRELRKIEKREKSAAQHGTSLLKGLRPCNHVDQAAKVELLKTIQAKQNHYLSVRGALEVEISKIQDYTLQTIFSLMYVDCMTADEAAALIPGSCSGGGILQMLVRYFDGEAIT